MRGGRGWLWRSAAWAGCVGLAACGGGGGGVNGTPTPPVVTTPAPTPAPTPSPTPTPTVTRTNQDSSEYRATVGAVSMSALSAYNVGATGSGVAIGIIDSGIDLQSEEFTGRVSSASRDVAGNPSLDDEGGHGTAVAFTAAGRRNGVGTHGVAYEATVIALRADRPGSCATVSTDDSEGGCKFGTDAIARGVDAARTAGARVINMSLGGAEMPRDLVAAIGRATAAGIVVVIAAGNDGTAEPDAFTAVAANAAVARGQVVIAGSVGAGDGISSFSDRAGSQANWFLTAVGERVRAPDETGTPLLWSGTSFAAPQIAGAVALLAQAFPNLSGAQIVELLYTTARDAGAPGADPIYGRGVLDLTRAFQPVGGTVVAGAGTAVSTVANGTLSAPMGDAAAGTMGAVVLDGYSRAFAINLAANLAKAPARRLLAPALATPGRQLAFAAGDTAIAVTLAARGTLADIATDRLRLSPADATAARAVAASVIRRLGRSQLAMGIAEGADSLGVRMAGRTRPAFLIGTGQGLEARPSGASAWRQQLGRWGLTGGVESGDVYTPRGTRDWRRSAYSRASLALDRRLGPLATTLGVSRLAEASTVLGARLGSGLGAPAAASWFVDAGGRLDLAGWTLGAEWRRGRTGLSTHGGIEGGGRLLTESWAVDLGRDRVFGADSLGLRLARPLRVLSGGLDLTLPTGWSYADAAVTAWTPQRLTLAPTGRELDMEARYARPLAGGWLQANLYWRRDPGNVAASPDDRGIALRYGLGF